jgi:hypothetical protein
MADGAAGTRARRVLTLAGALALAWSAAAGQARAQDARLTNADVRTVAASGSLASQVQTLVSQQAEPGWIGYLQPVVDSKMNACCYNGYNDGNFGGGGCCHLEKESGVSTSRGDTGGAANAATPATAARAAGPIHLEGATQFLILLRVEAQQIERVRLFSTDCELDAGGRRVTMITGITPAASIAWLETLIADEPPAGSVTDRGTDRGKGKRRDPVADGAISAIAWHRDPAADAALDRLVAPSRPTEIRRKATFWLANSRGKHGFDVVNRLVREDPDANVRKHAVFALTVTKQPGATPALLDLARHSPFTEVRSEAIFWVAQVAGRQAADTITEAIDRDPETEVKKKAVFALSQLPKDDGVPLLIKVARTNQNPAVRKQAMFWLGQSKDPRALDFFESVLK